MTITQFIEHAIEGGWSFKYDRFDYVENIHDVPELIFLDLLAWQAFAKSETKGNCICGTHGPLHTQQCPYSPIADRATYFMHRMVDALTSGQTIEQFLLTL